MDNILRAIEKEVVTLSMSPSAHSTSESFLVMEQNERGSNDSSYKNQHGKEMESRSALRRSTRQIVPPARYQSSNLVSMYSFLFAGPIDDPEVRLIPNSDGNDAGVIVSIILVCDGPETSCSLVKRVGLPRQKR